MRRRAGQYISASGLPPAIDTSPPVGQVIRFPGGGGPAPPFNPSDLNLSIYLNEAYAGSPWVGLASAGASGGRNATEATNPPTAGDALNGFNAAVFDGTNDRLAIATALSSIFGAGSYSGVVLFRPTAFGTVSAGASWDEAALVNDTGGYWGLHLNNTNSGTLRLSQYDGGDLSDTTLVSANVWTIAKFKWDGTKIYVATYRAAFGAGVAAGAPDLLTGTLKLGPGLSNAKWFTGSEIFLAISPDLWDDATFTQVIDYIESEYALGMPLISSVDKTYTRIQGGILITVRGINFSRGVSGVTIGGTAATSVTVVNDATFTCVTPAKAAGVHAIVATGPGGASNSSVTIEYVSPASIFGANLMRWYDSTYAAGVWTDETGNFNTSQATAGSRPTASTFAGTTNRPGTEFALDFDGTDDALNMGDDADIVTNAYTMAFIAEADATQNAEANVMSKNYAASAFIFGIRSAAPDKMAGGSGGDTDTELAISAASVNDDVLRRYVLINVGAATFISALRVNGVLQADTGVGAYTTSTADFNAIGGAMQVEAVADFFFTGKVGQCIIANVAGTGGASGQLAKLDAYLRDCAGQAS